MGWDPLPGRVHRAVLFHLGEDARIDGVAARVVTENPAQQLDVSETEYHGQLRTVGFLPAQPDDPDPPVGAIVGLRGRVFEVTAVVHDGEGMTELTARERGPDSLPPALVASLYSRAVVTQLGSAATVAEMFAELLAHGVVVEDVPAGLTDREILRWLELYLVEAS